MEVLDIFDKKIVKCKISLIRKKQEDEDAEFAREEAARFKREEEAILQQWVLF